MNLSAKTSFIMLTVSVIVAAVLDRLLFVREVPIVSTVLLVQPSPVLFGVPFLAKTTFGVLPLIVLPLFTAAILLLPVTAPANRQRWAAAWSKWYRVAISVVLTPLFMLIGGFLYQLVKGSLPKLIATVVESFGFKPTFYIGSQNTPLVGPLDGSLACLTGLLCGAWLLVHWLRK